MSAAPELGIVLDVQMPFLRTSPLQAAVKARHCQFRLGAFGLEGNGNLRANLRGVRRPSDGAASGYAEFMSSAPAPFATASKCLTLVGHRLAQGFSNARDSGCQVWHAAFFVRMQEQKLARSDPPVQRLLQSQRIGRTLRFVTR